MPAAKIDVFLPTFEPAAKHVQEALRSLFDQSEQSWRLWICDDASAVNVQAMLEPYIRDPRVTFERSPERGGIGRNWNRCLQYGDAPYVAYLFQDDQWDPQYLRTMREVLDENPDVGFVSANHHYVFDGETPVKDQYRALEEMRSRELVPGEHDGRKFLRSWMERGFHPNLIGEPSFVMIRRRVLKEVGPFAEDMPQFLDVDMWVRLLAATNWYFIKENLGSFRVHPGGASERNREEGRGLFDRFRCLDHAIKALPAGPNRSAAKEALRHQLQGMIRKFFDRKKSGQPIGYGGSGALQRFALRHPILTMRAMAAAMQKR